MMKLISAQRFALVLAADSAESRRGGVHRKRERRGWGWRGKLTPRNWGQSLAKCICGINGYFVGWIGFFEICTADVQ